MYTNYDQINGNKFKAIIKTLDKGMVYVKIKASKS
jgi:hypothetical protein